MKKNYTICLDEESSEIVKAWLKSTTGMSFSGFLNGVLKEFAREIQGQPVAFTKPLKDMTLEEFGKVVTHWGILASS